MRTYFNKNGLWTKSTLRKTSFCECVEIRHNPHSRHWYFIAWALCDLCQNSGIPPVPCSELPKFYPNKLGKRTGMDYNLIDPTHPVYEALTT